MIRRDLPEYLVEQLRDDGLIGAHWVYEGAWMNLVVDARLPRVRPRLGRKYFRSAQVRAVFHRGRVVFMLDTPLPSEVLHPNWDAKGHWIESKLAKFAYRSDEDLVELLRYMIGGLRMKPGCYAPEEAVNPQAVDWCRSHGLLPAGEPLPARELRVGDGKLTMHARVLIWRTGELGTVVKFPESCPLCKSDRSRISEIERENQWWWRCAACGNEWDPVTMG